jgi:uncharacterized protein with NRDE domain
MCVVFIALDAHPDHRLLLIANRDEFYDRPTLNLHRWEDHRQIRAGRDLVGGGTWLGVTDSGRFAAVTNFRDPAAKTGPESRGNLVADFLKSDVSPETYMLSVADRSGRFSGFNLLTGEINAGSNEVYYHSNRGEAIQRLDRGVYGLSNALLDTPWPKVRRGKKLFEELLAGPGFSKEELFALLSDDIAAADDELPDTGIGYEKEKALSSLFIRTPIYGTRSSSVVSIGRDFVVEIEEKVIV